MTSQQEDYRLWNNSATSSPIVYDGSDQDGSHQIVVVMTIAANELHAHDVILGREKVAFLNPGNKIFRTYVKEYRDEYQSAKRRAVKSKIVKKILSNVFAAGGRFLQTVGINQWTPVEYEKAYEKVSHSLRASKPSMKPSYKQGNVTTNMMEKENSSPDSSSVEKARDSCDNISMSFRVTKPTSSHKEDITLEQGKSPETTSRPLALVTPSSTTSFFEPTTTTTTTEDRKDLISSKSNLPPLPLEGLDTSPITLHRVYEGLSESALISDEELELFDDGMFDTIEEESFGCL